jgi:hypothetical protein
MIKIHMPVAITVILFVSAAMVLGLQPIQAEKIKRVEILNPEANPTAIRVGDTFSINATIVNNSPNVISVKNGCGGAFSVIFDNHASVGLGRICNWMAIQIKLKPGENITVTSLASNLAYKALSAGTTDATLTFSYILLNPPNPTLAGGENTITKSILFEIYDNKGEPRKINGIMSPLKQFLSGTLAKDVQCSNGFRLVLKVTNGYPACIESSDVGKLVLWGWAKSVINTQSSS